MLSPMGSYHKDGTRKSTREYTGSERAQRARPQPACVRMPKCPRCFSATSARRCCTQNCAIVFKTLSELQRLAHIIRGWFAWRATGTRLPRDQGRARGVTRALLPSELDGTACVLYRSAPRPWLLGNIVLPRRRAADWDDFGQRRDKAAKELGMCPSLELYRCTLSPLPPVTAHHPPMGCSRAHIHDHSQLTSTS